MAPSATHSKQALSVAHIVGTRPEFIQMAPVVRALCGAGHQSVIVHTGQHYDYLMSAIFFSELHLPAPDYHLEVGSAAQGRQTGEMITRLEEVFAKHRFDSVVVYGDTNSTLAGALAAAKLCIPIAHMEAGERSYSRAMPEEINRVLVDHMSDSHLCISRNAVRQLAREGISRSVHLTGDVMLDILLQTVSRAISQSDIMNRLSLTPKTYLLATVHRAANTDNPKRLARIIEGMSSLGEQIVFPVHPRTRQALERYELQPGRNVWLIDPIGYSDMLVLERNARMILTDSGGVLREAYFFGIPCLTLRDEIELVELVWTGWNILVGCDPKRIHTAWENYQMPVIHPPLLGDGHAAERVVKILSETPPEFGRSYDVDVALRFVPEQDWEFGWQPN